MTKSSAKYFAPFFYTECLHSSRNLFFKTKQIFFVFVPEPIQKMGNDINYC